MAAWLVVLLAMAGGLHFVLAQRAVSTEFAAASYVLLLADSQTSRTSRDANVPARGSAGRATPRNARPPLSAR